MTDALANWNGQEMPLSQVLVPALDRAFLFGDAVYEVIRVYGGRLWQLEAHLSRLASSLEGIKISGVDLSMIHSRLQSTLGASQMMEALAYVQITRGAAKRTHHFPPQSIPNVLIYIEEFKDPYAAWRECGVRAITQSDIRWARNDLKTTSLLANCLAAQAAHTAGCAEAILINKHGLVTEGSHTSVFAIRQGKIVMTPAAPNILPGITRRQVINLAALSNIEIVEGRLEKDDLWTSDEVFLTGTPEEILPVIEIDNRPVASGQVGSLTGILKRAFASTVQKWLEQAEAN